MFYPLKTEALLVLTLVQMRRGDGTEIHQHMRLLFVLSYPTVEPILDVGASVIRPRRAGTRNTKHWGAAKKK